MQHLALNVDTMADLLNMRDRIRSRGVPVFGPIHHGFCSSIYFAGSENLALEIATSGGVEHPLSANTWIDKEVQALAGISDEELQRFTNPPPFEGGDGLHPQPEYDPSKPHLAGETYDGELKLPITLDTPIKAVLFGSAFMLLIGLIAFAVLSQFSVSPVSVFWAITGILIGKELINTLQDDAYHVEISEIIDNVGE
ncbi:MAG: hypothetical protein ABJH52_01625 [Henriciella sp.]